MSVPILSYREVARLFQVGGARFLRQRGSHRIWERLVGGEPLAVVIPAHQDGDDVLPAYIGKARRRWKLATDDGVSDADFYAGKWPER